AREPLALYGRPWGAREDHRAAEKRTRLPYRAHAGLRRQQRLAAARRPHAQSADELPDRHRCRAAPPLAQTHRTPAPLDRADIALHPLSSRGTTGASGGQVDLAPGEESRNRKLVHAHRTRATLCGLSFCRIRVNYHVVSGYFTARDVKSGEVMTLQGSPLTTAVSSWDVRVNGARVTKADIVTTNGIVHGIDAVILPKHWQLLAAAA